jgi:hypothetical protein
MHIIGIGGLMKPTEGFFANFRGWQSYREYLELS